MNEADWRLMRDDRTIRYAERVLDQNRTIRIKTDSAYANRYDGQVAIITAVNLLGRMTPSVLLDVPDATIVQGLPWQGQSLKDILYKNLENSDPWCKCRSLSPEDSDYILHLGPNGNPVTIHGSGWNVYLGASPSPIQQVNDINPIGPALSAVIAISNMFYHQGTKPVSCFTLNALDWSNRLIQPNYWIASPNIYMGNIWTVGTGSVGTAAMYFLTLTNCNFASVLFDMDDVEVHNLDRSPIFRNSDVGLKKADATRQYLESVGVSDIRSEAVPLHESPIWQGRSKEPDILISSANELNVRTTIENGLPPVQIYGTTGANWQASVIRHWPMIDPCSCCLFPEMQYAETACATTTITREDSKQIDAALPFLSFAAGIMTVAEILKLDMPGYPFPLNRATLYTWDTPRIERINQKIRPDCMCAHRSEYAHKEMIKGTKYH